MAQAPKFLRIDRLSAMMKIIFLCFVLVCLKSVQAYTDKDLEIQAKQLKVSLSNFKPDARDIDLAALIDSTVDNLELIRSIRSSIYSESYQTISDWVFAMNERIRVKAENLAIDLSKENELTQLKMNNYYRDYFLKIGWLVTDLIRLPKILAWKFLFLDEPKHAPYKRVLITMLESIYYACQIKIEKVSDKQIPQTYNSLYRLEPLGLLLKTEKFLKGYKLEEFIMKMTANPYSELALNNFKDFIISYLHEVDTEAREKFVLLSRMSELRLALILGLRT